MALLIDEPGGALWRRSEGREIGEAVSMGGRSKWLRQFATRVKCGACDPGVAKLAKWFRWGGGRNGFASSLPG